ncbi:protein-tyrosine phosphatase [Bacillus oleivorans]|uniref:Tyrosine-protein phosphatase n=1 Tax=Bacillus oleivorans TaxID=1448271 RepID=A0A285CHK1_9BACI|nr:CpsB/CapC family capsule biosynthesis tyrosine phosphatase [Bacillus oleivorans]SNX67074.1 protein-tyrosine phosphatase [Bacillus oleivorans]
MIDIHCHILPNLDDGSKSMAESIGMAKKAVQEGINTIIATPHHKNGSYENTKHSILEHVQALNDVLVQEMIPLTILPGQEVRIYGEVLHDFEKGEILTLNDGGNYLFVEFPSGSVPRFTEKLLYDIQMRGLTPIIVHPERNQTLIENPEMLYQFVKKGALTQITAASITGHFGKKIRKFSLDCVEANLTHFIASDAHNTHNRTFLMREAYHVIREEFGQDLVFLFRENAQLLVEGKTVFKEIPERIKRKKILGLF